MTTPKEKAQELVDMMYDDAYFGTLTLKRILHSKAVEHAKILADAMLNDYVTINADLINAVYRTDKIVYWQQVRIELDYITS